MPNTEFLEKYPLYRKFEHSTTYQSLDQLEKVPVNMECAKCGTGQTFVMTNEYHEGSRAVNASTAGYVARLSYLCVFCKVARRYFVVRFADDQRSIMKVGQYPPWSIELDKDLKTLLGDHADLYSKGLISESQGYGVGAFAYYRQIVETVIDDLLDQIADMIPEADRGRYDEALAATKNTKVAQEKIELVTDLLPAVLRPGGANPLAILHDALSDGLHAGSDNECSALAAQVRSVLVFLVQQVTATKAAAKGFTASIRKLLDRKSGKGK